MKKVKIYIDMDGVLAKWNPEASIEDTFEPGYFLERIPDINILHAVQRLEHDFDTNILSAVYVDDHSAIDKQNWLINQNIGYLQTIFVPYGKKKADYIDKDCISILIDDYTKNLEEWEHYPNCYGIKYLNGINSTKGNWTGFMISHKSNEISLYKTIKAIVNEIIEEIAA